MVIATSHTELDSNIAIYIGCRVFLVVIAGPVEELLQRAFSVYCSKLGDCHEESISCRVSQAHLAPLSPLLNLTYSV